MGVGQGLIFVAPLHFYFFVAASPVLPSKKKRKGRLHAINNAFGLKIGFFFKQKNTKNDKLMIRGLNSPAYQSALHSSSKIQNHISNLWLIKYTKYTDNMCRIEAPRPSHIILQLRPLGIFMYESYSNRTNLKWNCV